MSDYINLLFLAHNPTQLIIKDSLNIFKFWGASGLACELVVAARRKRRMGSTLLGQTDALCGLRKTELMLVHVSFRLDSETLSDIFPLLDLRIAEKTGSSGQMSDLGRMIS